MGSASQSAPNSTFAIPHSKGHARPILVGLSSCAESSGFRRLGFRRFSRASELGQGGFNLRVEFVELRD